MKTDELDSDGLARWSKRQFEESQAVTPEARAVLDFAAYLTQEFDELQREHFVDVAEVYIRAKMPRRRVDSSLSEALNSGDGTYKP